MDNSETLFKAALNRLAARLEQKIYTSAEKLAGIAQEAPSKIRKEWEEFKKEVYEESERLEKIHQKGNNNNENKDSIKSKIKNIRSKVIELNKDIEVKY